MRITEYIPPNSGWEQPARVHTVIATEETPIEEYTADLLSPDFVVDFRSRKLDLGSVGIEVVPEFHRFSLSMEGTGYDLFAEYKIPDPLEQTDWVRCAWIQVGHIDRITDANRIGLLMSFPLLKKVRDLR